MVTTEKIKIQYQGKNVWARRLTVGSEIPIDLKLAWNNIKTPALLQFVTKGMLSFQSLDVEFPAFWEEGKIYRAKLRLFGFIPFGGTHYFYMEKIDEKNLVINAKEWDDQVKVWNHDIQMRDLGDGKIYYEDILIIYAGFLTSFITAYARQFYQYRHRRWQIAAKEEMRFGL